jgi:hypothetical protein
MTNFTSRAVPILRTNYVLAITCIACMFLSSCGSSAKNVELAKRGVEQFHSQLDSEQYVALYTASDEKFHQATSESEFVKLLEAVHRKLGNVRQSNLRDTGVAWFAGQGTTVTLVYDTAFANGSGTEKFVWHVNDDGTTLYGYHINSNDLIAK